MFTEAAPSLRGAPPLYITKEGNGDGLEIIIHLVFTIQPDNLTRLLVLLFSCHFFLFVFVSALDKRGNPAPTFNKHRAPPPPEPPLPALPCPARNQHSTREAESCIASRKSLFLPFKNVKNRGIRFFFGSRADGKQCIPPPSIPQPPLFIYLSFCFRIFQLFSCCGAQTELLLLPLLLPEWGDEALLHSADASREAALVKDLLP